jgi:uncharacterized protein
MPESPRELVERFLNTAAGGRPEDLADYYAAEVVIEMPFAPTGLIPTRTETTREALRARFRAGREVRTYERLAASVIHETTDPEVVIVEYDLEGRLVASGEPFTLSFVMVMTIRDGRIVHTRDYSDPIAGARALGRLPELLTTLSR